jgi:hypothetical protein
MRLVIAIVLATTGVGLCFRMGRAQTHLAELREATMPSPLAMVSTQASLPNRLLVMST